MKRILLAIMTVTLMLSACNKDKLNPVPQTDVPLEDAFSTAEGAQQQVVGMYLWMKGSYFLGSRMLIYNEVRGEDFLNRTTNGVTGFNTWNFTGTPATNEVQYTWRDIYQCINQCNIVLENIDIAPISEALKANYKGEALAVRGMSYYYLLTLYARPYADGNGSRPGVPLRLMSEVQPGNATLARSTVAQVYDQILKDLNQAETSLPLTQGSAILNTTRAHRNTVVAFKTRVLLTMQRWNDVITEAAKIVPAAAPYQAATGVANRLEPNIADVFSLWTTGESIFSMPFTDLNLPGTQNGLANYYMGGFGALDYTLNPTGILSNTGWKATDARRNFIGSTTVGTTPYNNLRKYARNPQVDYAPVIRYAEVMLNLAEARVRQTNSVDATALALLNAVRQRSDATVGFTAGDFANAQALLDQLDIERRIEFLGEGHRSPNVMRNMKDFVAKTGAGAVPYSSNFYIWPLPQSELVTNTASVQNPGY